MIIWGVASPAVSGVFLGKFYPAPDHFAGGLQKRLGSFILAEINGFGVEGETPEDFNRFIASRQQ